MNAERARKLLFFVFRLAFAAFLLTWLVRSGRLDLELLLGLRPSPADWGYLALGAAGVLVGFLLLGIRLRWLLGVAGLRVPLRIALRATVLGTFFGTLLPGLVGGDLVKAAVLCEGLHRGRRIVVGAVMSDRLIGLYSLFLLAALAIGLGAATGGLPQVPVAVLGVPVLVALGFPLVLVSARRLGTLLARFLPEHLTEKLEPLLASLRSLVDSPAVLLGTTALGVLNHALIVVGVLAAAEVLGAEIRLLDHWILDPLALTINVVPISPGGLGLAEGAFSYLYELVGSDQGAAVGVLSRAVQYLVFVGTGVLALLGAGRTHAGIPDPVEDAR